MRLLLLLSLHLILLTSNSLVQCCDRKQSLEIQQESSPFRVPLLLMILTTHARAKNQISNLKLAECPFGVNPFHTLLTLKTSLCCSQYIDTYLLTMPVILPSDVEAVEAGVSQAKKELKACLLQFSGKFSLRHIFHCRFVVLLFYLLLLFLLLRFPFCIFRKVAQYN